MQQLSVIVLFTFMYYKYMIFVTYVYFLRLSLETPWWSFRNIAYEFYLALPKNLTEKYKIFFRPVI